MANLTPQNPRSRGLLHAAVHDLSRFAFITNVLVRHGFSELARRNGFLSDEDAQPADPAGAASMDVRSDPADAARRFRMMLEELGPTFVKVGQILSTRPDVLPPPFVEELRLLQDRAPTVPFAAIQRAVEDGLKRTLNDAFATFDESPLASASMAQTHLATLPDGTAVVVKVQRPEIAETMRSDLDLLHVLARLLEATIRDMDLYAPADIVRVLDDALSDELDFLHEAHNLETVAEQFADADDVVIPTLYRSHTSRTVLTMGFIEGRSPADLASGSPEAEAFALTLLEAFYRMIFEHGTFHGDPHPGNLFVDAEGRLAFIDFGLCGYLSTVQRDRLVTLIVAVLAGDIDGIARTLLRMGRPTAPVPMNAFKDEVASIRERYLKRSLRSIDLSSFIEECFDAAQRYRIRIAADYSILSKAAVTAEGVVRQLAPDIDLLEHVGPYQRRLLGQLYSTDRLLKSGMAGAMHLGTFLRDVPEQLSQVLVDAEAGRLQVRVSSETGRRLAREMNLQTTRLFMALCCAALIIATPLFLAHEPWWWRGVPVATTGAALMASGFAFWGLAWHVVGGRVRDARIPLAPLLRWLRRRR